jgi:plasmid stabilization system protein ParE
VKIVFTDGAWNDLAAIHDFIAVDNSSRAATFSQELLDRCESLADTPEVYPLVPRHEKSGVRRRVYRNCLIFYRISGATIEILHIVHGARDYEPLLFPE